MMSLSRQFFGDYRGYKTENYFYIATPPLNLWLWLSNDWILILDPLRLSDSSG